jgi:hypothetical protein
LVCKDAGLGKTIHPLLNLDVDPTVKSDNVAKVIVDDDYVGDDVETETHVLRVSHGGVEVEIGKIDAQKLAPRVLIVELMRSLAMVRSAVGLLLFPG